MRRAQGTFAGLGGLPRQALCCLALGVLAVVGAKGQTPPAKTVPDLRGKTCDEARALLQSLHYPLRACPVGAATRQWRPGTINHQSAAVGLPLGALDGLTVTLEPEPAPAPPPPPPIRRTLPDLRGKSCEAAAKELAALSYRYSACTVGAGLSGYRAGQINAQSPDPGTILPTKRPIVLTVQPQSTIAVPNLVGMAEAPAFDLLRTRGLRANASGPPAQLGRRVLDQMPPPGSSVSVGASVDVRLGLTVPRLLGMECADARAVARRFGHDEVRCDSRPAPSPDKPIDRTFEQTPPDDAPVQRAPVAITVVVWAMQPTTVPDVRGQPLNAAKALLEHSRLIPRADATGGDRDVIAQQPAAQSVVNVGTSVQLRTVLMALVPDVSTSRPRLEDARRQLTGAHFRVDVKTDEDAHDRLVTAQEPAPGTRSRWGSSVKLVTVRVAAVPDLLGKTCGDATAAARDGGFELNCERESSWRVTVFGEPRLDWQDPQPGSREAVDLRLRGIARAPLPGALVFLRNVSLPVVAGGVGAPFVLGFLWFFFKPVRSPPSPAPATTAVRMHWRGEPDVSPGVTLRRSDSTEGRDHRRPVTTWRVVRDDPSVLIRGLDVEPGARDVHH